MEPCKKYSGPCYSKYSIADCMGAKGFLYWIGLLFTLHHCNPVHAAEQKSLHFVGDTKSNPVCAILEKAKCKQLIRYALGFDLYVSEILLYCDRFYNAL